MGWAAPVRGNGSVARVAIAPDLKGKIRSLLKREQFDVLHLHEPRAPALPLTLLHLSRISGAVNIGTFHAYGRHGLTSTSEWAYVSATRFVLADLRRLDGPIAVSTPAAAFGSRFFHGDYRVIPNGVDVERFSPRVPPLARYNDGKLNVLYLGRLEARKGAKYLLRAIPLIREHYPNTRFIIAGDGPLRAGFQRLVAQAGLRDVVFPGRIPAEELPALYTSAHVYCAPNTGGESQGVVLLEAMGPGRAVVASDIPGLPTGIHSQPPGLLVGPSSHEALDWSVCHLLSDVGRRRLL